MMAKVVRRVVDSDGKAVGTYNSNPILNTMVYECEFPDGAVKGRNFVLISPRYDA